MPERTGKCFTTEYKPVKGSFRYFEKQNQEFQFEIGGKVYSGEGDWNLQRVQNAADTRSGHGAALTLLSADKQVEVTLTYLLYPDLPVVRGSLSVRNLSTKFFRLESVDIEKFKVTPYNATTFSWICHDYGRRRSIGPFDGNMQDALVTVHNSDWQQGIEVMELVMPPDQPNSYQQLIAAVTSRRVAQINYQAAETGELTSREIEPIGLYLSQQWHVIAYCRLRQAFRDFRLDRIASLTICVSPFLSGGALMF